MIAFGWSAGDLAAAGKLTWKVVRAFREAGGASEKYKHEVQFLQGFQRTLELLQRYVESNTEDTFAPEIGEQSKRIQAHWEKFAVYLKEYDRFLSDKASANAFGRGLSIVKYTLKDLAGQVDKLKKAATEPLSSINMLLGMQIRWIRHTLTLTTVANTLHSDSIGNLPQKTLTKDDLTQLLEAIRLTALPATMIDYLVSINDTQNEHQDALRLELTYSRAEQEKTAEKLEQIINETRTEMKDITFRSQVDLRVLLKSQKEEVDALKEALSNVKTHDSPVEGNGTCDTSRWLVSAASSATAGTTAALIMVSTLIPRNNIPRNNDLGAEPDSLLARPFEPWLDHQMSRAWKCAVSANSRGKALPDDRHRSSDPVCQPSSSKE